MSYFPFESLIRRQVRKLRALAGDAGLIGYINQDNAVQPVQGDEHGPYVHLMGRASDDGSSGAVSVADGSPQLPLTDELGRLWTRDMPVATSGGALSRYSTLLTPDTAGVLIKASAGRIFQMRAIMPDPGGHRYAMVFNTLAAPVNTTVPIWRALLPDPTGTIPGEVQDNWADISGLFCSVGIAVAISTTPDDLTLPAPAEDVYWHITYV